MRKRQWSRYTVSQLLFLLTPPPDPSDPLAGCTPIEGSIGDFLRGLKG